MVSDSPAKQRMKSFGTKKLSIDFIKYSIVGFFVTIISIFLKWLFIDIFAIATPIASGIVVVSSHILKFISYHKVNLIRKQFVKYTTIQFGSGLLNIIGDWFLIDILKLPTVLSLVIVVSVLYVLRFVVFKITKLTIE
jgi:putative flippase GtrA